METATAIATATEKATEAKTVNATPVAAGADEAVEVAGTAPVEDTHPCAMPLASGRGLGCWALIQESNPEGSTTGSGQGALALGEAGSKGLQAGISSQKGNIQPRENSTLSSWERWP